MDGNKLERKVVRYKNDPSFIGVTLSRKNSMSFVLWTKVEDPEWVPDYCLNFLYSVELQDVLLDNRK